jgi:hypothetical protein
VARADAAEHVFSRREGARTHGPNSVRAMEQAHDLIRPWRRATIAVSAVAAVELMLLAVIGILTLGNPITHHFRASAAAAAEPRKRSEVPAPAKRPTLPRSETSVMVLNGNGRAGAAHAAAARVQAHGYMLVMYRPGYDAEGRRLARDLHVRIVRPLDGMHPAQLLGSHLVLIIGT